MTRPTPRTEPVGREEYTAYLAKAREYTSLAHDALRDLRYSGAGLGSIHGVISACDAFTIFQLGVRHKGEDHRDVVQLMKRVRADDLESVTRQVISVLNLKNRVEYGGDGLSVDEAGKIVTQAERILRWVEQHLR